MTRWQGAGLTNVGCVRTSNQDAYRINNRLRLWIVADGMGSHPQSGLASHLAVETIHTVLDRQLALQTISGAHPWQSILHGAISRANEEILNSIRARPELLGMGTTVVLGFMPDQCTNDLYIAHVGDSRAYLCRSTTLSVLTHDHTLLEERIRDRSLPPDTPATHRLGHLLTKAVGIDPDVEADCAHLVLQDTDRVVLCSDGLNKMLSDEAIRDILMKANAGQTLAPCQDLINAAIRLGGHDNVTVVVVENKNRVSETGNQA